MTALEHCSRFHRMVMPLPVWHRYFQDGAGLGVVSASMCTGVVPVCLADASPAVTATCGVLAKASIHARCCLTAGMYFVYKGTLLSKSATVLFAAVRAVVRREAAFGVFAKPEEVMETGNQCAICQVGRTTLLLAPSAQR